MGALEALEYGLLLLLERLWCLPLVPFEHFFILGLFCPLNETDGQLSLDLSWIKSHKLGYVVIMIYQHIHTCILSFLRHLFRESRLFVSKLLALFCLGSNTYS